MWVHIVHIDHMEYHAADSTESFYFCYFFFFYDLLRISSHMSGLNQSMREACFVPISCTVVQEGFCLLVFYSYICVPESYHPCVLHTLTIFLFYAWAIWRHLNFSPPLSFFLWKLSSLNMSGSKAFLGFYELYGGKNLLNSRRTVSSTFKIVWSWFFAV